MTPELLPEPLQFSTRTASHALRNTVRRPAYRTGDVGAMAVAIVRRSTQGVEARKRTTAELGVQTR